MKVKCIYAISPILEEGKVYTVFYYKDNFLLLDGYPYNYFNIKHFEVIDKE